MTTDDHDDSFLPYPPSSAPLEVAHAVLEDNYSWGGESTLVHWRGNYWAWTETQWAKVDIGDIEKDLYYTLHNALKSDGTPWSPTKNKVTSVEHALRSACRISPDTEPDTHYIALHNGLLDPTTKELHPHTPTIFNTHSLPFDYKPEANPPTRWTKFLESLWGDDPDSIRALQQWFGYIMSGRTNLQKMMFLIGPARSGKSTIVRILEALIGRTNTVGLSVTTFGDQFGLSQLPGKSLATIGDARDFRGSHGKTVVSRMLSISGEDSIDIDIKYAQPWHGRVPARIMLLSNVVPDFDDKSSVLAKRFIGLQLLHSFLGDEDPDLEKKLLAELPEIFNWALAGLDDLTEQGSFIQPESGSHIIDSMEVSSSPMRKYVEDNVIFEEGAKVGASKLYHSWCEVTGETPTPSGHKRFGRELRGMYPRLDKRRARENGDRSYAYIGIRLRDPATDPLDPPSWD